MPLSPPYISPSIALEVATSMTSREKEAHEEMDPKEEERVFQKAFLDMTEMVRILYQERNDRIAGEGSKNQREGGDSSGGKRKMITKRKGMEEMVNHHLHHHPLPQHHPLQLQ